MGLASARPHTFGEHHATVLALTTELAGAVYQRLATEQALRGRDAMLSALARGSSALLQARESDLAIVDLLRDIGEGLASPACPWTPSSRAGAASSGSTRSTSGGSRACGGATARPPTPWTRPPTPSASCSAAWALERSWAGASPSCPRRSGTGWTSAASAPP